MSAEITELKSDVRGVSFYKARKRWIVTFMENGRRMEKYFSLHRYGNRAKEMAENYRTLWDQKITKEFENLSDMYPIGGRFHMDDDDDDTVIWTRLEEFPKYLISNNGDVRSFPSFRPIRPTKVNGGYLKWNFMDRNGDEKTRYIHRLVATVFVAVDDPERKTEVDHIHGDLSDVRASQLEWVTPKVNKQRFIARYFRDKNGEGDKEYGEEIWMALEDSPYGEVSTFPDYLTSSRGRIILLNDVRPYKPYIPGKQVQLSNDECKRRFNAGTLVLLAFGIPREHVMDVCKHKDGDTSNNCIWNLCWKPKGYPKLIRVTDDTTGESETFSGVRKTAEHFRIDFCTMLKYCRNGKSFKKRKYEIMSEPED